MFQKQHCLSYFRYISCCYFNPPACEGRSSFKQKVEWSPTEANSLNIRSRSDGNPAGTVGPGTRFNVVERADGTQSPVLNRRDGKNVAFIAC